MIHRVRARHFGGHGHHGFGQGFVGHGFGGRGFGGRGFFALRRLGLDREQREQVWSVVGDVKRTIHDVRADRARGFRAAARAVSEPTFDRARVEAEANRFGEALTRVRAAMVDGLERVHAILTPEQRARLRDLTGGDSGPQTL
jgi:Spy/CpxP family protein refolding chaperone